MKMKNLKLTRPIALLMSGLMLTSTFSVINAADDTDETSNGKGASVVGSNIEDVIERMNALTYAEYQALYTDVPDATSAVIIDGTDYDPELTDADVRIETYEGREALFTPDDGSVVYSFDIPKDGMYMIEFDYYPTTSKQTDVERQLYIDDKIPFKETGYLTLKQVWESDLSLAGDSKTGFQLDALDNDVRPNTVLAPVWQTYKAQDSTGYYTDPFLYYFSEGTHTLKLTASRCDIAFGEIRIQQPDDVKTYEEVLADYTAKGYKAVSSDATVKLQAEFPTAMSAKSIYPTYDKTSPISEPQHESRIRLNTIGKDTTWQYVGDWVEYKLTVEESGLYHIVTRHKQSVSVDMFVTRKLLINGELPFEEAKNLRFTYGDEFETRPLTDGKTEFQFYFEAGKEYTLRFEIGLGELADLINRIQVSMANMNKALIKVKQITGDTPDEYRDYNFIGLIPNEMNLFLAEAKEIRAIANEMEEIVGYRGSQSTVFDDIADMCFEMGSDESTIAGHIGNLTSNIGTLGTWMNTVIVQPLEVDYISVQSVDEKIPAANANLLQTLIYEVKKFIASFFADYSTFADEDYGDVKTVVVWMGSGRDQATLMRQMVNDMFSSQYGIPVDLKLVAGGALLPSVLAGQGPDISLDGVSMDWAIRSAIMKLDDFDTFDEVCSRFDESALIPLYLDIDSDKRGHYGIPVTQTFDVVFYRQDIFAELGVDLPQTWDEIKALLPLFNSKNYEFGVSGSLMFHLYQRGGDWFADGGRRINWDNQLVLETFKDVCDLFTQYQCPTSFDGTNRFRTGEMPYMMSNYGTYTQLTMFATDIRGMWGMSTLPGYEITDENGNTYINNTGTTSSGGVGIMANAKNPEGAWDFIDWYTDADAQIRYGNEYATLLGSGTIYTPANLEAMLSMNWSNEELEVLMAQFNNLRATPMYPGDYIISRYESFAFDNVYNEGADPVEELLKNINAINREISRKRQEFGLDYLEIGETLAEREAKKAQESGEAGN